MPNWTIYVVHAVAWGIFIVARVIGRRATAAASPSDAPVTQAPAQPVIAAGSRSLVVLHSIAFTALYTGLGQAIGPDRVPIWWAGQSVAGAVVILGGAEIGRAHV